ncbi:Hypothetical predicted protein [Octopus vulgaris]|uniref:Uncharacterized protein n=1 Tax=Octopus vulgaris TaxID=6645 RepID=A0AA36FGW0_OCTVU|nr:Hypothetical predicted protein [Octopus vulgaris]
MITVQKIEEKEEAEEEEDKNKEEVLQSSLLFSYSVLPASQLQFTISVILLVLPASQLQFTNLCYSARVFYYSFIHYSLTLDPDHPI